MKRTIATIISRIFDPVVVLSILLILTFVRSGETSVVIWVTAFILIVGLPLVLVIYAIRKKIVGNWDISNHSERPKALAVLVVVETINLLIMESLLHPPTFHILVGLFIALIGFTLITLRFKISGHTMANALLTGYIVRWYGVSWWPVFFIVPLVGWARIVTKNHTHWQVIAGALYAWSLVWIFHLV